MADALKKKRRHGDEETGRIISKGQPAPFLLFPFSPFLFLQRVRRERPPKLVSKFALKLGETIMKTIFLSLILMLVFGSVVQSNAQTAERVALRINKQKKLSRSKLTIKFVSLVEDSRCPEGTNCIWAGNAKIKVKVSSARESKIFELNTNLGAKGETLGGYAINLESLTPHPAANIRIDKNGYTATFSVKKLSR
jgi:hypothetical protein